MKTSKINPPVLAVTAQEVERAKILQAKFEKLSAVATSLGHEALRDEYLKAAEKFNEDPTADNMKNLKQAEEDRQFFSLHTRSRSIARAAVDKFLKEDVRAWAEPIVRNALSVARDYLARVTDSEQARHKQLTGRELGQSEVIQLAAAPVAVLEGIWRNIEPVDITEHKKKLFALRGDVAAKRLLYDVARANYVNEERLAPLAKAYDLASNFLRQAEQSLAELKTQLAARRTYTPDEILELLSTARASISSLVDEEY